MKYSYNNNTILENSGRNTCLSRRTPNQNQYQNQDNNKKIKKEGNKNKSRIYTNSNLLFWRSVISMPIFICIMLLRRHYLTQLIEILVSLSICNILLKKNNTAERVEMVLYLFRIAIHVFFKSMLYFIARYLFGEFKGPILLFSIWCSIEIIVYVIHTQIIPVLNDFIKRICHYISAFVKGYTSHALHKSANDIIVIIDNFLQHVNVAYASAKATAEQSKNNLLGSLAELGGIVLFVVALCMCIAAFVNFIVESLFVRFPAVPKSLSFHFLGFLGAIGGYLGFHLIDRFIGKFFDSTKKESRAFNLANSTVIVSLCVLGIVSRIVDSFFDSFVGFDSARSLTKIVLGTSQAWFVAIVCNVVLNAKPTLATNQYLDGLALFVNILGCVGVGVVLEVTVFPLTSRFMYASEGFLVAFNTALVAVACLYSNRTIAFVYSRISNILKPGIRMPRFLSLIPQMSYLAFDVTKDVWTLMNKMSTFHPYILLVVSVYWLHPIFRAITNIYVGTATCMDITIVCMLGMYSSAIVVILFKQRNHGLVFRSAHSLIDKWDNSNIRKTVLTVNNAYLESKELNLLELRIILSADGTNFQDEMLVRAMAFLSTPENVASEADIKNALDKYLQKSQKKSLLLLLAYARFFCRQKKFDCEVSFLREFEARVGKSAAAEWMTKEEIAKCGNRFSRILDTVPLLLKFNSEIQDDYQNILLDLTDKECEPLNELMKLIGLEEVKKVAIQFYKDCLADRRLRENSQNILPRRALNFLFVGNPGTGKTVTAELFGKLLEQSGVRKSSKFIKMTAGEALRKGALKFAKEVESLTGGRQGIAPPPSKILRTGMAVEVTDNDTNMNYRGIISRVNHDKNTYNVAYADDTVEENINPNRVVAIAKSNNHGGVLFIDEAYDLDPSNNSEGRAILNEIMSVAEEFRETVTIILAGYRDDIDKNLVSFNKGISSRFQYVNFDDFSESQLREIWRKNCKEHQCKCGEIVENVASRRLGRSIGRKTFGNARDVRKLFESSFSLAKQRFGVQDAELTITIEDVIGKKPSRSQNKELDDCLRKLESLIGLDSVKKSVMQLVATAEANYDKELQGEPVNLITLNRLFVGNPGTGKTTVASIYGSVLKSLRYLSHGDIILKTASDFIGDKVGESQTKTKAILEAAEGKVLFIDEAYVLDDNMYGKQALDTIVEKVHAKPGADIAVIMAGYKDRMFKMLRDQNPGLASRFDPKFAIDFQDFDDGDLLRILSNTVASGSAEMPFEVKRHAVTELGKRRALPNFGNARAVETLYAEAKSQRERRLQNFPDSSKDFVVEDVDPDFDNRDPHLALKELEKFGGVAEKLKDIGSIVSQVLREGGSLAGIVNHFVFTGAPGTGKTTVARLIARVLFSFGILATKDVVETSGTELMGQYVGHTADKVQRYMEKARGGVLFVDEAYYMTRGGFSNEIMGTFLQNLTNPDYMDGKTVVILAGYKDDMDEMLAQNEGLRSRFRTFIDFKNLNAESCFDVVRQSLEESRPISFEFEDVEECRQLLDETFKLLIMRPGWANGRDAVAMAKEISLQRTLRVSRNPGENSRNHLIEISDVRNATGYFLESRPEKRSHVKTDIPCAPLAFDFSQNHHSNTCRHDCGVKETTQKFGSSKTPVSDEEPENVLELMEADEESQDKSWETENNIYKEEIMKKLQEAQEEAYRDALQKELERLREIEERARLAKEAEKKRIMELERKRQAVQRRLAAIGKCPQGYAWLRNGAGFRCAGGTHYASASQLNLSIEELDEIFPGYCSNF